MINVILATDRDVIELNAKLVTLKNTVDGSFFLCLPDGASIAVQFAVISTGKILCRLDDLELIKTAPEGEESDLSRLVKSNIATIKSLSLWSKEEENDSAIPHLRLDPQ